MPQHRFRQEFERILQEEVKRTDELREKIFKAQHQRSVARQELQEAETGMADLRTELERVKAELERAKAELVQLRQATSELETRGDEFLSRASELAATIEAAEEDAAKERADLKQHEASVVIARTDLGIEALRVSKASWEAAQKWLATKQDPSNNRQSNAGADLEEKLSRLRRMEEELESFKDSTAYPELRERMNSKYEELRSQLDRPESNSASVTTDTEQVYHCILFSDCPSAHGLLAVQAGPFAAPKKASSPEAAYAAKMNVAELTGISWNGYSVWYFHHEIGESSINSVLDRLSTAFKKSFAKLPGLKGLDITVEALWIGSRAFESGKEVVEGTDTSVKPESPTVDETAVPAQSKVVSSADSEWYRDADIVSWDRPLSVSETSRWNIQGRRLRTLLIRLLGAGCVADKTVRAGELFESLPETHRIHLERGVEALCDRNILLSSIDREELRVTINPKRLEDIQALVNRDITDFWAEILAMPENTATK